MKKNKFDLTKTRSSPELWITHKNKYLSKYDNRFFDEGPAEFVKGFKFENILAWEIVDLSKIRILFWQYPLYTTS